ncbi:MAG: hypothetical protein PSX37_10665, partial [bacterium]|nr:hypothetical protein [bacterium]
IGDQFNIARNDTGAAAGTATVTTSTGSQILVGGETRVGDSNGGAGTLRLNGGSVTTRSLTIDPTNGVLDLDNGVLTIDGGAMTLPPGTFAINGGTSTDDPMLQFTNGATLLAPSAFAVANLASRSCSLRVLSGSEVRATDLIALASAGAVGSDALVMVSGLGSLLKTNLDLWVGGSGHGEVFAELGGRVESGSGDIGTHAGGTGLVQVTDAGTRWDCTGLISIGGMNGVAGGIGSLGIFDGASVTASGSNPTGMIIFPNSLLHIQGGNLQVTNAIDLRGDIFLNGGTISASQVSLASTASINATGTLDMSFAGTISSGPITLSGPLTVGRASSPSGQFICSRTLNVGSHALSIWHNSPLGGGPRLGDVVMSGGSITMLTPNRVMGLANGDSLTGYGTINGDFNISSAATVTANGGLTFTGIVRPLINGSSITVTGGNVQFPVASSGFTGAGTFDCIVNATNATFTATGPLTLGNGGSIVVGLNRCNINVGSSRIDLNSQFLSGSGNIFDIRGGTLAKPLAFELIGGATPDRLRGHGHVAADLLNLGIMEPDGNLIIDGNFSMFHSSGQRGTLITDISGGSSDRVTVNGVARVAGTLQVRLAPGFVPIPGSSVVIISAQSVILDFFNTVSLPPRAFLDQSGTTISVRFACISDLDADDDTDSDDVLAFFAAFEAGDPTADMDGDGDGDSDDVIIFFDLFDFGC